MKRLNKNLFKNTIEVCKPICQCFCRCTIQPRSKDIIIPDYYSGGDTVDSRNNYRRY
ncbi:hypothetical protein PV797_13040 [Clostridiaceae bacterium M8S5]|nr:hypothetical protein PV797_13040 [Clostridiaceae bacterium M8S5]